MTFKATAVGVVGVLVGAALGVGAPLLYQRLKPAPPVTQAGDPTSRLLDVPSFGKLRPAGAPAAVAALGRLTPRGETIDIGGLVGDRLGKLEVEEGQRVEAGAVLGQLESHGERAAERDAFAAQLKEAEARLAAELAYCDAQIKVAEVAVRQARELEPLDIEAQAAKVRLLETELKSARADMDRLRSLTSPGSVPQQKLDQQAQAVLRFEQELIAANAALKKGTEGHALSQQAAQAQLDAARAGRQRAEATVPVASLAKNLALAEVRLGRTVLRAPRAGEVLKIMTRPGERVDQKPILKLGDTSVMYAVAEVYETDVLHVRSGQRASVSTSAWAQAVSGTVERVGHLIFKNDLLHVDPAAAADARVVEVWIRLDRADEAAGLTNLQVDVVIDVRGGTSAPKERPARDE